MKIRLFYNTLFVVFTIGLSISFGQTQRELVANENGIQLQGKHYQDSIVLRWGYTDAKLWYKMLNQPVKIYRRNITNNGKYEAIAQIMPWDSSKIETTAAMAKKNEILMVVLENIYRNWQNSTFSDYGSVLEKTDNFNNRWSLVHLVADQYALAAEAAGLRFTDKFIDPKVNYAYKVVAEGSQDYKVITSKKANFKPVIYQKEEKESSVVLYWDQKLHDYHYTSYWVESSSDGINYKRLTEVPFVQMMDKNITTAKKYYTFTAPNTNYQKNHYRLIGNDAFGDESMPSEPVLAMGRDRTPPLAAALFGDTLMHHLTKNLYWTLENPTDIKAIHLERSIGDKTETLLNWAQPTQRSKTDTVAIAGIYKYRLITADTAGNFAFSSPLYTRVHDMIPPVKPPKPVAYVDTSGVVTLGWNEHSEPDIIGYNIYAADGKKRNFIKLNAQTHRSRVYADTIGTSLLNEKRYYFIVAVDDDFMRSPPSDTIIISRPDKIPPSPALIGDYRVLQNGIQITILPSSSRDVVRHDLWRKTGNDEWQLLHQFTKIPPSFTDTEVKAGITYFYKIHAVDDGGLISKAVDVTEIAALKSRLSKPEISITKIENTISLSINDPTSEPNKKYMLYKAIDNHTPRLYEILPSNSFTETGKPGVKWRYRVKSISSDGRQGPFSDEIIVEL